MRILFVCRRFHDMAGGIERMATHMMNDLVKKGHEVAFLTWDSAGSIPYYNISNTILWYQLNLGDPDSLATWTVRLKRQIKIRYSVKEFDPDVIIAFQVGAFLAIRTAIIGLNYPVIAAERNSTDVYRHIKKGNYYKLLSNIFLTFSKHITVQLPSYVNKYPVHLRTKISVIPNPAIYTNEYTGNNNDERREKIILCVGRLSFQKNHEFLLNSFSLIAPKYKNWRLVLIGDGDKFNYLYKLKNKLSLNEKCQFIGKTNDVVEWYKKSSFLVLPSLWEGFPNVLIEAFSYKLPAIGLRTTSGVNELIEHGINGVLSDHDKQQFAKSMELLMSNEVMRKGMGDAAILSSRKYNKDEISLLWEKLFFKVCKK